jgi:beta-lactam-binding protein with PASTA domain
VKRLAVVALIVAIVALLVSVAALWTAWDNGDSTGTRNISVSRSTTTTIPLVTTPSQAGKNVMVAGSDLQKVGLGFTIVYAPSVTTPRDRVISQHPVETTRVPKGTVITLVASSGTP